ncbi:MAG: ABC transporter permease [Candidatus Bipolaricaulota bacterium]|nr:ABC transporter permease [Candidatus Bipolaricaulota bacterium]MDW8126516.1 ABC transporter permease [Candidatus Bipolaricaulota bacterium]
MLLSGWRARIAWPLLRLLLTVVIILGVFGVVLWALGKDPLKAYRDTFRLNILNPRGLSEVVVRMAPLLLTALGVAIPFRAGLINVGAEGQFMMGALLGTWAALNLPGLPAGLHLSLVILAGMLGGAAWAAIPGLLRALGWVNETITTLLLNYLAPLVVGYFVFGPWRAPELAMYPQTPELPPSARFPTLFGTRLHLGFFLGLFFLLGYAYLISRSRWGLELRAVGGNPEAARRLGLPVERWLVLAMVIGGALAGLAGIAEVAAIHGRLKMAISPGYGFMGFLVNWLAFANPFGILLMAFLIAFIASSGFTLQITQRLPYAAVNVLMALILFTVLAKPLGKGVKG